MSFESILEKDGVLALAPEVTDPELIKDIQDYPSLDRFAGELVRGCHARGQLMRARQIAMKQASDAFIRPPVEGLGQRKALLTEEVMNYMVRKFGPRWFRDKDFFDYTLKHHPELAVKSVPTKFCLRVNGLKRA